MAERQRVYQGVRVRTTVKELLQRLRAGARADDTGHTKTISRACAELQDLCASTCQGGPVAPPPPPAGSCVQMPGAFNDIQQQFGDVLLPGNGYTGMNINNNNNNNNHNNSGSGYPACLPPLPAFPLPCFHGLSSDADYYGHGMAHCSSPEPLALGHPLDHSSSYSPQDSFSSSSFSSSSSSCYDSPTRMESCQRGGGGGGGGVGPASSQHFHYQPCGLQDGGLCWPGPPESFSSGPEYSPYFPPTDYPYACPADQDYFRRDSQMSSEMCYNVL